MKSITLNITTAIVLSGAMLAVAQAAPPANVPTAVVKFGDLDATRPAGKEELYRRLTQAARSVCRSLDPSVSAAKRDVAPLYKACIDQAVSGAVARFNRQDFSEYVVARQPNVANASLHLADR